MDRMTYKCTLYVYGIENTSHYTLTLTEMLKYVYNILKNINCDSLLTKGYFINTKIWKSDKIYCKRYRIDIDVPSLSIVIKRIKKGDINRQELFYVMRKIQNETL